MHSYDNYNANFQCNYKCNLIIQKKSNFPNTAIILLYVNNLKSRAITIYFNVGPDCPRAKQ